MIWFEFPQIWPSSWYSFNFRVNLSKLKFFKNNNSPKNKHQVLIFELFRKKAPLHYFWWSGSQILWFPPQLFSKKLAQWHDFAHWMQLLKVSLFMHTNSTTYKLPLTSHQVVFCSRKHFQKWKAKTRNLCWVVGTIFCDCSNHFFDSPGCNNRQPDNASTSESNRAFDKNNKSFLGTSQQQQVFLRKFFPERRVSL